MPSIETFTGVHNMAKVTMATIKSFVKKNNGKLFIKCKSHFDGMVDCVMPVENDGFTPAMQDGYKVEDAWFRRTLGIQGAWFVGESRDYFTYFEKDGFKGYEVYNACGSFEIAVKA